VCVCVCGGGIGALTVEAGEVPPVEQGAVEGRQGAVVERVGAVGRVAAAVGEQVHLQQGLDQVAQHLDPRGPPPPSLYTRLTFHRLWC